MKKLSSYQRRKNEAAAAENIADQYRRLSVWLLHYMKGKGVEPPRLGPGLRPGDIITTFCDDLHSLML